MWAITQTAIAAGLAWYLTRDVVGHLQPFFAPIAAAVCLWSTNVVRAELAAEMTIGVAVGIGVGTGVHVALGSDPIAIAVAVLLSLWVAVTIAQAFTTQKPMFVNQTVISAILILAFPHSGIGLERLYDALIGGGLAVVFSILLFPKNPLIVLRDARRDVLSAVGGILTRIDRLAGDSPPPDPGWTVTEAALLHRRLTRLVDARGTAAQLARYCPRRWSLRTATDVADRQAAQLALLASSVLPLLRTVTTRGAGGELLNGPLHAAISDLSGAVAALADDRPRGAAAHAAAARRHTATLQSTEPAATALVLASMIDSCAGDLQHVIDLAHP